MKNALIKRLERYAKIDTQSEESSNEIPTTEGQMELAQLLVKELKQTGLEDVVCDDNGYVMATLPSNTNRDVPTIGFLAHLDTATDFTGKNVKPQLIENYDGKDITLNDSVSLKVADFPELSLYKGHTLMTTDGTTLLGADNKAGIAEIMTAMEYLYVHPEMEHGKIRVAFTPDEEIGRGPHHFDVEAFDARFAYTVDGGPLGELQYESFNAAIARITFSGNSVHPGTAKGKMINASKLASEFIQLIPKEESPEYTEGYEGFYHLLDITGDVETATITYIIRDFDEVQFKERKETIQMITNKLQQENKKAQIKLNMTDQYYNMRDKIKPVSEIVDIAKETMESLDIKPIIQPVRGGTDGSQLSYKGLPTPNLFTGGENFHGKYEYISIDNMEQATRTIIGICNRFALNINEVRSF